jgi:hypothetical protein
VKNTPVADLLAIKHHLHKHNSHALEPPRGGAAKSGECTWRASLRSLSLRGPQVLPEDAPGSGDAKASPPPDRLAQTSRQALVVPEPDKLLPTGTPAPETALLGQDPDKTSREVGVEQDPSTVINPLIASRDTLTLSVTLKRGVGSIG